MTGSSFLGAAWRESRSFSASGTGLEFGLERIRDALAAEDHPEDAAETVLVGGTNGKGGTAAFAAGVLQAHGRRVGLYTSPHLLDVRERFRIDGRPVSRQELGEVERQLEERYGGGEGGEPELTFFEATTLAAALVFERAGVDVAIYEVGLGGRLDATNALDPDLSVLTTIGRDHTEYLGETIREIAAEKCGILRAGRPSVVGYQRHSEALDEIRTRATDGATRIAGRDFRAHPEAGALESGGARWRPFEGRELPAAAMRNAAVGLEAAKMLLGGSFDRTEATTGLRHTRWPGRFDLLTVEPGLFGTDRPVEVMIDAAHNPEAVEALFESIAASGVPIGAAIVGGMADKELARMFRRLSGGPPVWAAELDAGRAARGNALESYIPDDVYRGLGTVEELLPTAAQEAASEPGRRLLVFGSTYLVGSCFRALGYDADDLVTYRGRDRETGRH